MLWRGRDTAGVYEWMDHTGIATSSWWVCISQGQSIWAPRCIVRSQSQVDHGSPQGSWSQVVTLPADLSCPGSQEDMGSGWQSAHILAADVVSGVETAAALCLLPLAGAHLPLCFLGYKWQQAHPTVIFTRASSPHFGILIL